MVEMTFHFVRKTKNYDVYEQKDGINKLYLPHDGGSGVPPSVITATYTGT